MLSCKAKFALITVLALFLLVFVPALAADNSTPQLDIYTLQALPGGPGNSPQINPYTNTFSAPDTTPPAELGWWQENAILLTNITIIAGGVLAAWGLVALVRRRKIK